MDYLTEDSILPTNQKYVCLSYLMDKETLAGIKIRGVFDDYDKACEYSKKLQGIDQYFDIYVGEMGKWLPVSPDKEKIKNVYSDEKLNNIMENHMKSQEQAKILHEQRKNEMMRENIIENINNRKNNIDDLKNNIKHIDTTDNSLNNTSKSSSSDDDLEEIKINNELLKASIESAEEQISKMSEKKEELDKEIITLSNKIKYFGQEDTQS